MTPSKPETSKQSEIVSAIIQAQIGTPKQSDSISSHMEEYFKRFPSYRERFTGLEWYHIFMDFLDKIEDSTVMADRPGLRWVKPRQQLPLDTNVKAARIKDGYISFRLIEGEMVKVGAFTCHSLEILEEWFPSLEWLDESADQDSAASLQAQLTGYKKHVEDYKELSHLKDLQIEKLEAQLTAARDEIEGLKNFINGIKKDLDYVKPVIGCLPDRYIERLRDVEKNCMKVISLYPSTSKQ